MRINAGQLRARIIAVPDGIRPMSDKVRAALFDVIGSVDGVKVLDLYGGSGAIGFEAFSRGASEVAAVESSSANVKTIKKNQASLGLAAEYQAIHQPVERFLTHDPRPFDLIVADPPYDELKPNDLERVSDWLAADGIFVLSHSSRIDPPDVKSLELIQSKHYGDTALSFYRVV